MRRLALSVVSLALALSGCPGKGGSHQPARKACSAFGDQCEFAPGKLGSCVVRDNCSGKDCYVCQSQH